MLSLLLSTALAAPPIAHDWLTDDGTPTGRNEPCADGSVTPDVLYWTCPVASGCDVLRVRWRVYSTATYLPGDSLGTSASASGDGLRLGYEVAGVWSSLVNTARSPNGWTIWRNKDACAHAPEDVRLTSTRVCDVHSLDLSPIEIEYGDRVLLTTYVDLSARTCSQLPVVAVTWRPRP